MHGLVLEDAEHGIGTIEERVPRPLDVRIRERVEHSPIGLRGELLHDGAIWPPRPVRCPAAGGGIAWIDPAREQGLERRIDARFSERLLQERVEAERRQVAFIEDDRMAQLDGPAVVRVLGQQIEQPARPIAVAAIASEEGVAIDREGFDAWDGHA